MDLNNNKFIKKILYAEADYNHEEIQAVTKVLENNHLSLMSGDNVKELEIKTANLFNKKFGLMVNSGSSANLLGLLSLNLTKQTKIITPALTFATTVAPIVQAGLIPLFVDVERETLQIDISKLHNIDLTNVSGICVPNLIGNIANWEFIYNFAKENNLKVIEDSADTIGYKYKTNLKNWSDISTTSFYASHLITGAGFGGMVSFNDEKYYELALKLRGWGRRSTLYKETEDLERRFNSKIENIDYDDKYIFDEIAYNFLPSEISAAFALVQMKKLEKNIKKRIENYQYLKEGIGISNNFFIPNSYKNVETGWLAFPVILENKLSNFRTTFQKYLESYGIQTRTIFSGNIIKQPMSKNFNWESIGTFEISDEVTKGGILVGCHGKLSKEDLNFIVSKFLECEKKVLSI